MDHRDRARIGFTDAMPAGERCNLRRGQGGNCPGTLDDPISPVRWNGYINRNVRTARFHRGQKSDQHFGFFVTEDGDRRVVAGITLREIAPRARRIFYQARCRSAFERH